MASRYSSQERTTLQANKYCDPEKVINILLMGQTGVGKTTFINAFANCISNDTLEQAVDSEMQVIIPSSFSFTTQDTFDERTITIGTADEYEKASANGEANTQQCRSFVFPIGNRNLRIIDTPGVGDPRGLEQDNKNFEEILTYIAQYEHLNAVFILLKPNEERLSILFRFCVNELLRHLHTNAKENLIFIFTNARASLYTLGSSKRLLEGLLKTHREEHDVVVPFSMKNSFLFDNESFRYLAIRKNGITLDDEQTRSYTNSWDRSVKEYSRLMSHIVTRPLHAVSETLSLNAAEQLVRKLPRPIAETAKLIEENIQLANEHKRKVLDNPQIASEGIPQNDAVVITLKYPRTVCMGENCCQFIEVDNEQKIEYLFICHDECYLAGVVQETLNDPKLEDCTAMDAYEGLCTVCGCHWLQHKHITYEYNTNRIHLKSNTTTNTSSNKQMSLSDIDKRIGDLREEAAKIQDVYTKLARFLHANAILPINDAFAEYLQYFIREEQMKQNAGARNTDVIAGLEKLMTDYNSDMISFKKASEEQRGSANAADTLRYEEIFKLVGTLYRLPITGRQIREQVNGIKISQEKYGAKRENYVELPAKAASSQVMLQLRQIVSGN